MFGLFPYFVDYPLVKFCFVLFCVQLDGASSLSLRTADRLRLFRLLFCSRGRVDLMVNHHYITGMVVLWWWWRWWLCWWRWFLWRWLCSSETRIQVVTCLSLTVIAHNVGYNSYSRCVTPDRLLTLRNHKNRCKENLTTGRWLAVRCWPPCGTKVITMTSRSSPRGL